MKEKTLIDLFQPPFYLALLCASVLTWSKSIVHVFGLSLPIPENVTGIAGSPILLNCSMNSISGQDIPDPGQVIWMRPGDSAIMSHGYRVFKSDSKILNRLMVVGDPSKGEYNLFIRYAIYPQDVGTWFCASDNVTKKINLMLLVRPDVEVPSISPTSASSLSDSNELTTFTCTGHYAFPPVQLTWVKEYGPDVSYEVTPPTILVSTSGLMSVSIKLILSSSNAHSLFACFASHPTFLGKVFSNRIRFHFPADFNLQAETLTDERPPVKSTSSLHNVSIVQLDTIDRVFIILVIFMISFIFAVGVVINKCRSKWDLDVPLDKIDQNLNSKALCEVVEGETIKKKTSARGRQNCTCKVLIGLVLFVVLITSVIFAFPMYYKGITIPSIPDGEELTSVMAGSSLWLDCRSRIQPLASVVQVQWFHNSEIFYYQYKLNGQDIGFPHNSTKGFMMGMRVSSQGTGQVTIYPVAPGEDGRYSCHATLSAGDDGRMVKREKTTTVFVMMGPIVNYGLIIILVVALLSALGIFILIAYHSLIIHRKERDEDRTEDEET